MAIIYSKGFQESITNDGANSKPVINVIKWDTNYKKNKGTMNVNINKNGKKNKYKVKLKKNDLENLLKMPVVNEPIEKRLTNDFIMLESPQTTSKLKSISNPISNPIYNPISNPISNPNIFQQNNDYSELENLFMLRKKLLNPYHLTHATKGNVDKINTRKKSRKNKANKKNKAKGTRKNSSFFRNFSNML